LTSRLSFFTTKQTDPDQPEIKFVMLIDAPHRALDALLVFGFGILLSFIGIGGAFGPKPEIQISSSRIIHHRVLQPPLRVKITDLTPFNVYLHADIQFVCKSYKNLIHDPLFLNLSLIVYSRETIVRQIAQPQIQFDPIYPAELTKVTNPLRLFFENIIDFDEIEFNVSYNPAAIPQNVEYIVSTQYRATPSFSIIHLIMRILLSIIIVIVLTLFYIRMSSHTFKSEQLLTVVLVILSLLEANAIFYSLNLFVPSYFCIVWDTIWSKWFESYFRVYVIAIFDVLCSDDVINRNLLKYSIYFVVNFLLGVYHELNPSLKFFDYNSEAVTNNKLLFFFETWSDRIFFIWLVYTVVNSAVSPRLKRPRRLRMYLGLAAVTLFWHGVEVTLCRVHVMLAEGATHAGMTLAWRAGVPLMCLFFFWPSPAPREPLQMSSSSYLRRLATE
jgi:hypothetical protein